MCDWIDSDKHPANMKRLQKYLKYHSAKPRQIFKITKLQNTDDTAVSQLSKEYDNNQQTLHDAVNELDEYFSGKRKTFSIPLLTLGTPFQILVRDALQNIPYGTTISYSQISDIIEHPKSVRAVAAAIASNPISIFLPCHRIIGSDGNLTGYAGGLSAKKFLLNLESTGNC